MTRYRKYTRPEYRWCTSELTFANNLRRVAAEEDILETALDEGRADREEVHWGGRWLTLQNTELLTAYHMRDGDEVSFDFVFGSDPLPEWFLNPDGSWLADLDLT